MEPAGRYPLSIDFFKRSIHNQNLMWAMVYGAERYPEREGALGFLILRCEESPEFFTIPFFGSHMGKDDNRLHLKGNGGGKMSHPTGQQKWRFGRTQTLSEAFARLAVSTYFWHGIE